MRTAWGCFCLLISVTIICIIFYLRNSMKSESVRDWRIRNWNVFERVDESKEETLEEFENQRVPLRGQLTANGSLRLKTILYWNTMYAEKHRHFMFGTGDVFRGCPVPHCYGTPDRKWLNNLEDYDAILFHGIEMNTGDLPTGRSDHQRYIFFSWESPASRIRDLSTNEIISPPRDPAGIVPWRTPKSYDVSNEEFEIIKSKSRMAAWFVSHCNTHSRRETLVEELKKYFKVDIYGQCGKLRCNKENNEMCNDLIERDYFFYFSFENTLCKDYVTEKLFSPMSKYTIPVVYGGADYSKFAPPHSYINIMDFNSTSELADYLLRLSRNPVEYASYFWWKSYYQVEDTTKSTLCDLCEKLHNNDLPKKTVGDFTKYYITDQCYPSGNLSWIKSMHHWR
ncbi:alpha-(1,3)-fucosyltransferase C isoform X2 [Diachasma alloeum]|uniref:alpha-(1,3)-fucosyltransferase C isoform X2 n=1 Tax=Diachasma alloeum TaxID=454923 RepID=UPI00073818A4|nr:alpha-(1,3)-fucosyltransferase C isoform X2 [Diachasma alloeum]